MPKISKDIVYKEIINGKSIKEIALKYSVDHSYICRIIRNNKIDLRCHYCNKIYKKNNNEQFCSDKCRFLSYIEIIQNKECWNWLGRKDQDGYGIFCIQGKPIAAHKYSYFLKYKKNIKLKRLCDNRGCCNPEHYANYEKYKLDIKNINSKKCNKCKIILDKNNFHNDKSKLDKIHTICKTCKKIDSIIKYGLSYNEFNQMIIGQCNKCIICKIEFCFNKKHTTPHIDHDHKTGKIRALLCANCNSGIGFLKDDIKILENAFNYLKKYKI